MPNNKQDLEVREQILRELCYVASCRRCISAEGRCYWINNRLDQILKLVAILDLEPMEQEITEFAEMLYNFREAMDIKTIKNNIESFLLANHLRRIIPYQAAGK